MYTELKKCLCCNGDNLTEIFDLGMTPLANSFSHQQISEKFELSLNLCLNCYHSQLKQSISREMLFENYLYVSGTSSFLDEYFEEFALKIGNKKNKKLNILDIASNDGSLLEKFNKRGHKILGIDPAKNIAVQANNNMVPTICAYWPLEDKNLIKDTFDVIVAMNVFAHVNNPKEFLLGMNDYTTKKSSIYIQTSQSEMFTSNQFDTIYHEHISFFNTRSFLKLIENTGFFLEAIEKVPVHGISYLWKLTKDKDLFDIDGSVKNNYENEENLNLYNKDHYKNFQINGDLIVEKVKDLINLQRNSGNYKIVACGIAAKGMTFLNYGNLEIDIFLDNNKLKQNKYVPGYSKKVESFDAISQVQENCLFIIPAWNFKKEIIKQIESLRTGKQDKVITYYPQVEIIDI